MKQRISASLFLRIFTSQVVASEQADERLVVWLVNALALLPPSLAVAPEEHVELPVEVDAISSLMVLVAQPNRATLTVADRPS